MAFPPDLPAQVQTFAARVKAALGSFFRMVRSIAEELRDRILLVVDRLSPGSGRFRWNRRMIVIASLGGGAVLLLIIVGASLMSKDTFQESQSAAPPARREFIPPDELFLPDEPDFVPGVLLEREQRTEWTTGDAAPLWQDPLKDGEEPWRIRIEQAIEEIMESIP